MSVETGATLVHQLNKDYPYASDFLREGDDHLRLIKTVLLNSFAGIDKKLIDFFYPVGIIKTFADGTDPNTIWGGTWVKCGVGRVLMGASGSHPVGSTGGSETTKITAGQLPPHFHSVDITSQGEGGHVHSIPYAFSNYIGEFGPKWLSRTSHVSPGIGDLGNVTFGNVNTNHTGNHAHRVIGNTGSVGSGQDVNLMQPYEVVVHWKRTA